MNPESGFVGSPNGSPEDGVELAVEAKLVAEMPRRIGGLMRCCLETLSLDSSLAFEGQIVGCLYCSSSMVCRDGAFEWNRP